MGQLHKTVANRATINKSVDLSHVNAFVRVMEAGSFTGGAKVLGLPKSSVSRAVAQLERTLGVQLIARTTRKLVITEAGQAYLTQARVALSVLAEAQAKLRETDDEPSGLVRLTAPLDPAGQMYVHLLASFARRYPQIHVEVVMTQRHLDLVAEGIDLAIRAMRTSKDSGLVGRRLGNTPFILVASPSYLKERGTPRRFAQLADHECILFRGVRGSQRWTLTSSKGSESVQVRGALSVDELSYALHLALAGVGVALVPQMTVAEALRNGTLVHVLSAYRQEGAAVYLVHPANPHLPRRVVLLRDHLAAGLRQSLRA